MSIKQTIVAIALVALLTPILPVDAAVAKKVVVVKKDPVVELRKEYEAKVKELQKKIEDLAKKVTEKPVIVQAPVITAEDIAPYLSSVALIYCVDSYGNASHGSGTFVKYSDGWAVVTNYHVLDGGTCVAIERNYNDVARNGFYLSKNLKSWNQKNDIAVAYIEGPMTTFPGSSVDTLQVGVSYLRDCIAQLPLGTPVAVVGYPASAVDGVPSRILTTGGIAGYNYGTRVGLPYLNYYISAKADRGNSGGLVIAKDQYGMCQVGPVTWVQVGSLDTMAIAINIWNVRAK